MQPLRGRGVDPWLDVTGWEAVAHVPLTLTWASELGARSFHARLNFYRESKGGEHEGEEGERNQRRHGPDPFLYYQL
jgi:hypothetical protein